MFFHNTFVMKTKIPGSLAPCHELLYAVEIFAVYVTFFSPFPHIKVLRT